jgi:Skp family chaperone for outer membrane proteins
VATIACFENQLIFKLKTIYMKKNFLSMAILAVVVSMASCGSSSSFEGDVKKFANMRCKAQQLAAKDQSDEKVKKELEDLQKEMEAYGDKMTKKYESKKDDKEMEEKADKIMEDIMNKCK